MFGKSYAALSPVEKIAVDQWVFGQIAANYQMITPQWLLGQTTQQSVAFQAPENKTPAKS